MGIIVSTIHAAMKFHTSCGIGIVFSTCEPNKVKKGQKKVKETIQELPTSFKRKLQDLMRSNADFFAWTYVDMTGILRTIMVGSKPFNTEHKLNKYKHIELVKQKKRGLAPERIKQHAKKWTSLQMQESCKKSNIKRLLPLPEIDWKVESVSGFQLKCFLDAYKGYHQIQMTEDDEDNTSFFIENGLFCYRKMSFGVKNAEATYQRLVDKVFNDQIRLWSINMKLNPKKCSFGVEEDPFQDTSSPSRGLKLIPRRSSPEGKEYTYALSFEFETTNNEAEYEALLAGQHITIDMKIKYIAIFVDSQLVAN
uniref:Reverse transcriptase domain-containing protein n=1 Tax=Tanacetum cinerariifolium TaxID=118510 RepID=A0A6L2ND10_TANCI|nr:hypothetical protein [Tanacetum cinerariifolium]